MLGLLLKRLFGSSTAVVENITLKRQAHFPIQQTNYFVKIFIMAPSLFLFLFLPFSLSLSLSLSPLQLRTSTAFKARMRLTPIFTFLLMTYCCWILNSIFFFRRRFFNFLSQKHKECITQHNRGSLLGADLVITNNLFCPGKGANLGSFDFVYFLSL